MNLTPMPALTLTRVGPAPEDVLPDDAGGIVTGLADGRIVRATTDGTVSDLANTSGRPLGLDRLPDGRILVCDTERGLLAVAADTGRIEMLVPRGSADLNLCNNPAVAADGRIFFSDSSQRCAVDQAARDIIDAIPTGRLLCRHPDGRIEVLVDGLLFANGVVLAPDESFVLVAQTGRACINRLWLSGPKAGRQDLFADNMPGLPDNLSLGSDGLIWVALVSPNSDLVRRLHGLPYFLRYVVGRLPAWLQPKQPEFCRVAAYDVDGRLVHLFEGDRAAFYFVTGVRERDGVVYMGTLESEAVATFAIRDALG